jgi:thymidylate synthase (FAD)
MKVTLLECTPGIERLCYDAARTCYADEGAGDKHYNDSVDPEKVSKLLRYCIDRGHESVIEHATFTFSIEGVSRALTHQLVRHRLASFSQQSQRYVKMDTPTFVTPKGIEELKDSEWFTAKAIFENAMKEAWMAYNELVKLGLSPEDARFVLPNACTTNIVVSMNCRELLHFFSLRCCMKAQWEIRAVADEMLTVCQHHAPAIFEKAGRPCIRGECKNKCEKAVN